MHQEHQQIQYSTSHLQALQNHQLPGNQLDRMYDLDVEASFAHLRSMSRSSTGGITPQRGACDEPVPARGKIQDKELRTFGVGAQILNDLNVRQMRVMSAPKHLHALAGFDLEVIEFVDLDSE